MSKKAFRNLLTDQVSNLDSSVPKTDVLPITPSVIIPLNWVYKYRNHFLKCKQMQKVFT